MASSAFTLTDLDSTETRPVVGPTSGERLLSGYLMNLKHTPEPGASTDVRSVYFWGLMAGAGDEKKDRKNEDKVDDQGARWRGRNGGGGGQTVREA